MSNLVLYDNLNKSYESNPFPHSTYSLLTPELCEKLVDNIKSIKQILSSDKGLSSSRFKINLEGNTTNGLHKHKHLDEIRKLEPLNSVIKEFEKNIPEQLYKKYNTEPKKSINYCLMLVYDVKNYEIGPHTDSQRRNATMVLFLGPKSDLKIGTRLYVDTSDRHKDNKWMKTHYDFDNFKEIKMVDYYPGSAVDFKVSPISYHGVPKINEDCERVSIQFFICNS